MKASFFHVVLGLLLINGAIYSQSMHNFGPVINFSFPTEELSHTHEIGYEVGAEINFDLGSPASLLHIAAYFNYFEGKVVSVRDSLPDGTPIVEDRKLLNFDLFKFVIGGKFYNKNGFFIKPAVTYTIDTNYERIGGEFGAGYAFDYFDAFKLELGIKLAAINVIGKKDGEYASRTINFDVAFMF